MKGRRVLKQKNPQHIAIVMDGNGRWAKQKGLERIEGHKQGVEVVKKMIEACLEKKITILSLFAFSHENWARPVEEINFLMELFLSALTLELPKLITHGIKLKFLGSRKQLSAKLNQQMDKAEFDTQNNQNLLLNIALNYSGKWDILNAMEQYLTKVQHAQDIREEEFVKYLSTCDLPDPDLLIRTSGEQRISNFFLWQIAYTELYFTDILWPDFDENHFNKALEFYFARERRFGKTSQQLKDEKYV